MKCVSRSGTCTRAKFKLPPVLRSLLYDLCSLLFPSSFSPPDYLTKAYVNQWGLSVHQVSQKYQNQFYPAIFNDFAARMNWAESGAGNRNPVLIINNDSGLDLISLSPEPGTSLRLDAADSHDPDGDKLEFSWWVLPEAGTYEKNVTLKNNKSSQVTINVLSDSGGKSIHIICEVKDDGSPFLTSYRRIVVEPFKK